MVSKTGSVMAKVSAVLTFIVAALVLIAAIFGFAGMIPFEGDLGLGIFGGALLIIAIIGFVFGFLYLKAADMMMTSRKCRTGAIIALVLGILGIGSIIGIIGIIAGIFGLVDCRD